MGSLHSLPSAQNAEQNTDTNMPQYTVPDKPYERPKWFQENFGLLTAQHILYLTRVCGHLPKWQAITFSSIDNGVIHIHYGRYSLYFPIEEIPEDVNDRMKLRDWIDAYELEIDGEVIPMNTGLELIQTKISREVASTTSAERLVDKLLPPKVEDTATIMTTQHKIIKHSVRLRKK